MQGRKTGRRVSCGNAGAVESVESQKQASPTFHESLGNLAGEAARFPHFHSSGDEAEGKVENQETVSPLPPPPKCIGRSKKKKPGPGAGSPPPPPAGAPRR